MEVVNVDCFVCYTVGHPLKEGEEKVDKTYTYVHSDCM